MIKPTRRSIAGRVALGLLVVVLLPALAALPSLAQVERTTVARLLANPTEYDNRIVLIPGVVTAVRRLGMPPMVTLVALADDDGAAAIWVVFTVAAPVIPSVGCRLEIQGVYRASAGLIVQPWVHLWR